MVRAATDDKRHETTHDVGHSRHDRHDRHRVTPLDEERIFDFVRQSEESVIDAGRKLAKTLDEFLPVEVPAVRELVEGVFDFTAKVMKIQRELAQRILEEANTARSSPRTTRRAPRASATHRVTTTPKTAKTTPKTAKTAPRTARTVKSA